jgi:hypothetical protein
LKPLPRIYLALAIAAIGLGTFVVVRQAVAPVPPVTTGCLDARFEGAETGPGPAWATVVLSACPHFDETTLDLWIDSSLDSAAQGGLIFQGSGPGDPHRWPRYLRVRWLSKDSLLVEHTAEVRFLDRRVSVGSIHIRYAELAGTSR